MTRIWPALRVPDCPADLTEVTVHLGGAVTRRFLRQSPLDGGSLYLWDEAIGGMGASGVTWPGLMLRGEVREVER